MLTHACVCVMHTREHATVCMCVSQKTVCRVSSFLPPCKSQRLTQALRLGGSCPYALSHFAVPVIILNEEMPVLSIVYMSIIIAQCQ